MPEVYEPQEDSQLMLPFVRKFAHGHVLDMGTGSGILALTASKLSDFVFGADINEDALAYAQDAASRAKITNIRFVNSDLFQYFYTNTWLFDLIIFNPPYLPEDLEEPEEIKLATTGGKKGYEILDRFFSQVSRFLKSDGKILICFSTLTHQDKVHEIIENHGFSFQKLAEEDFFAETIFVYIAEKNDFLKSVEEKGIFDVRKFAKGHRGIIYTAQMGNKPVIVKMQRSDIQAIERIANEARWLKVLNRKEIGPKFISMEKDYFIYEFVQGEQIIPYLKKSTKQQAKQVISEIFSQCFEMDKIHVNKEEMHNPYKHILVDKNVPVMIDFERAHYSEEPKNITQFCQFIISAKIYKIFIEKGFKFSKNQVISAAKKYKKKMDIKGFTGILKLLK